MQKDTRIYVAGHRGMVGSAILRRLKAEGYKNIITQTHKQVDLTDQRKVRNFFQREKIDYVVLAAAKVGGIHANNTYPAEFIYQNIMIEVNVIHEAHLAGVERLLFLGSSCIYPRNCPQPMKEEYLLTGQLEPTNEPYAIAKIAGVKLCEAYNRQHGKKYFSVMPTNLYGPNDNYDLETSHVFPALIRKFHLGKLASQGNWEGIKKDEARYGPIPKDIKAALGFPSDNPRVPPHEPKVVLWGTGSARREFLHVDDMADACVFLMSLPNNRYSSPFTPNSSPPLINIGCGQDQTIRELATQVAEIIGYRGDIIWDETKPDGTPRKLLDVTKLNDLGWKPRIQPYEGIESTYRDYTKKLP
jgi:GDP-L-fucose synthase